jgi:hypothetical protein
MLVAVLVAVTVAFWTNAPVVSVTVPLTDAVCALAVRTRTSIKLVATANRTNLRSIINSSPFVLVSSIPELGGFDCFNRQSKHCAMKQLLVTVSVFNSMHSVDFVSYVNLYSTTPEVYENQ